MACLARIITFQLLFEFTKCRELSDIDGNFIPSRRTSEELERKIDTSTTLAS